MIANGRHPRRSGLAARVATKARALRLTVGFHAERVPSSVAKMNGAVGERHYSPRVLELSVRRHRLHGAVGHEIRLLIREVVVIGMGNRRQARGGGQRDRRQQSSLYGMHVGSPLLVLRDARIRTGAEAAGSKRLRLPASLC
jgi:hypothetical protein